MKTTPPPYRQPRDTWQRLLEIAWGLTPFIFFAAIVGLSFYHLTIAAALLLAYTLGWFLRLMGYAYRLVGSYVRLRRAESIDWRSRLNSAAEPLPYQALIIATYNEPPEMLEATLRAVLESDYDLAKVLLVVAYEERGGAGMEKAVQELVGRYGKPLLLAEAVRHPLGLPGEAIAKAGNITYAARWLSDYCRAHDIAASDVVVTTLDTDNRPHRQYLAALACTYLATPERTKRSYQPIPLFTNNIWDAPAPTRLTAADTSFWFMMDAMRPRRLRLFSAYAQSLQTLEEVGYWNVESLVEDGHQYWRSYFAYSGDHHVVPIWLPVYQDAVLSGGYWHTLAAQFRQLRRWAWSTADTPYIIRQALRERSIGWWNKLVHVMRQMDDYLAWSTTPIVLAIGAWLPWMVDARHGHSPLAFKLFHAIIGLQILALGDLLIALVIYLLLLPPRPKRYGPVRSLAMVLQWVLEPLTLIIYVSIPSLVAHARLVVGLHPKEFDVTTKKHL